MKTPKRTLSDERPLVTWSMAFTVVPHSIFTHQQSLPILQTPLTLRLHSLLGGPEVRGGCGSPPQLPTPPRSSRKGRVAACSRASSHRGDRQNKTHQLRAVHSVFMFCKSLLAHSPRKQSESSPEPSSAHLRAFSPRRDLEERKEPPGVRHCSLLPSFLLSLQNRLKTN